MITKHDLAAAEAALDSSEAFGRHASDSEHTAQAPLDAPHQEPPAHDPPPGAAVPAECGRHASAPQQSSSAAPASAADPLTPPQCELELARMVDVQREVFTALREFLPCCAEASDKTRILVSELLRVTEEQSSFILQIKTQLALKQLCK